MMKMNMKTRLRGNVVKTVKVTAVFNHLAHFFAVIKAHSVLGKPLPWYEVYHFGTGLLVPGVKVRKGYFYDPSKGGRSPASVKEAIKGTIKVFKDPRHREVLRDLKNPYDLNDPGEAGLL